MKTGIIRNFFSLAIISLFLISCGNSSTGEKKSKEEASVKSEKIEFDSLVAHPENYIGKSVIVEGKVVHVCTHSGKKLFIVGANPDITLFIAAGENISKFPMELLGSEVSVEGTITRPVSSEPVKAEEKTDNVTTPAEGKSKEMCETEAKLAAQPSLADIVMEYKSHSVK